MTRRESRKQASKRSSVNSDTCTEEFLLWKKKKGNAGLYLKDDYKIRDTDGTFLVCVLWPYFLESGGT